MGLGPFPRTGSALRAWRSCGAFPAHVNIVLFSMKSLPSFVALALFATSAFAQTSDPLTIRRPDGASVSLSAAQLSALPRITGRASAHGNAFTYEGHDLREVLRLGGITPVDSLRGRDLRRVVVFAGSDGYAAVMALSEFDSSIGGRRAIIVDREDGKPLPAERGPRRVIVEGDHRPTRWVRQLVRVDVVEVSAPPTR